MQFKAVALLALSGILMTFAPSAVASDEEGGYFRFTNKRQIISYILTGKTNRSLDFSIAFITPKSSEDPNLPDVLLPSAASVTCNQNDKPDLMKRVYYISEEINTDNINEAAVKVLDDFCNTYRRIWLSKKPRAI
jgi:hypothetical protein